MQGALKSIAWAFCDDDAPGLAVLAAVLSVTFLWRLPFLFAGYGPNDAWRVAQAAREMALHGHTSPRVSLRIRCKKSSAQDYGEEGRRR